MSEVLPGVTLDPRDEAGLEQAFGVTSNAEELIRQNKSRFSQGQEAAAKRRVNPALTASLYTSDPALKQDEHGQLSAPAEGAELKPELEEAVGQPIVRAVVRGEGRNAVISYVFVGPRGSNEKDIIPYAQVFGSASERKQEARETPESILAEGDEEARQKVEEARQKAAEKVRKAHEEAQAVLDKAEQEAAKVRDQARDEAVAKAQAADPEAEKRKAARAAGKRK